MPFIGNKPTAVPLSGDDIQDGTIALADLSATGTKDSTTFLRGDNTFASAGGTNTPFFEAIMSANQTVSDATDTKVQFDTENFDTNSAYDHSTNYRFTVPSGEAGKYFIYVVLNNASNTNSDLLLGYVYLYKNGSPVRISHENATSNGGRSFNLNMNLVLDLSVGDYLEVFGRTDVSSGTPRFTAEVGAGKISTFGGYKIIE